MLSFVMATDLKPKGKSVCWYKLMLQRCGMNFKVFKRRNTGNKKSGISTGYLLEDSMPADD